MGLGLGLAYTLAVEGIDGETNDGDGSSILGTGGGMLRAECRVCDSHEAKSNLDQVNLLYRAMTLLKSS